MTYCLSWGFYCCDKTSKATRGIKDAEFIPSYSLGSIILGSWDRNMEAGADEEAMEGCAPQTITKTIPYSWILWRRFLDRGSPPSDNSSLCIRYKTSQHTG